LHPATPPTPADTILALGSLFARHGPPLVLKTDNGSAFSAGDTLAFLDQAQVIPLFSPPRTPRYNGAIEAGIGSLKTRTECHALRHGRSAGTWEDVKAARREANATSRPRGLYGPTPDDLWPNRSALTSLQRALFQATLDRLRREVRIHEGYPAEGPLPVRDDRAVERHAIRRALVEHGYLLLSRRRIPLSFTNISMTDIT